MDNIFCQLGHAEDYIEKEADLIIANLIFPVIKELFAIDKKFRSKFYLVSGLFGTEAYHFKELINKTPLAIIREEMENFWSTFLLRNQGL